jgi:hypothetical protein
MVLVHKNRNYMDLLLALMIIPTYKNYYLAFCLVPLMIQIGIEFFHRKSLVENLYLNALRLLK